MASARARAPLESFVLIHTPADAGAGGVHACSSWSWEWREGAAPADSAVVAGCGEAVAVTTLRLCADDAKPSEVTLWTNVPSWAGAAAAAAAAAAADSAGGGGCSAERPRALFRSVSLGLCPCHA
jgi:hypothetical protein